MELKGIAAILERSDSSCESIQWNWKFNILWAKTLQSICESIQWNWKVPTVYYTYARLLWIHSMELKVLSSCLFVLLFLCSTRNPFNGIERGTVGAVYKHEYIFRESIQWNWKWYRYQPCKYCTERGIHSMELKDSLSVERTQSSPMIRIHSMELKGKIKARPKSTLNTRIHSMELKATSPSRSLAPSGFPNPFNGIEREPRHVRGGPRSRP